MVRRRLIVVLSFLLMAVPSTFAQDSVSTAAWRQAVAEQYAELSAATIRERKMVLSSLPAEMIEDLWILHMNTFLRRHPELTTEQRAVVHESIGLVAAGFIRVMLKGTPNERAAMEQSSNALLERAKPLLGPQLVRSAFYDLGDGPPATDSRRGYVPNRIKSNSIGWYNCYCADNNDCGWPPGSSVCEWTGCIPTSSGCGYMAMYGCGGECT